MTESLTDEQAVEKLLRTLLDYLPTPKTTHYRAAQPGAQADRWEDCQACDGQGGQCAACEGKGLVKVDAYTSDADQDRREARMGEKRETLRPYELESLIEHLEEDPTDSWTRAVELRDRHWRTGSYGDLWRALNILRRHYPVGFYAVWTYEVCGGLGVREDESLRAEVRKVVGLLAQMMPKPIRVPSSVVEAERRAEQSKRDAWQRKEERNARIIALRAKGWSTRDIASKYGMSDRHVRRICRGEAA